MHSAPEQQLQLRAHEGISLLLKTIVGNWLLQTGEEERMKAFEQLGHSFFWCCCRGVCGLVCL